ncbi:unnamed protein product [Gadus morhua 'NCC']
MAPTTGLALAASRLISSVDLSSALAAGAPRTPGAALHSISLRPPSLRAAPPSGAAPGDTDAHRNRDTRLSHGPTGESKEKPTPGQRQKAQRAPATPRREEKPENTQTQTQRHRPVPRRDSPGKPSEQWNLARGWFGLPNRSPADASSHLLPSCGSCSRLPTQT